MLEHAGQLEQQLKQCPPDQATVTLHLTEVRCSCAPPPGRAGSWGFRCRWKGERRSRLSDRVRRIELGRDR
jgi:hypothetical protein